MPYENFLVNEPTRIRKRFRRNLIGEELAILNPARRKRHGIAKRKRRNIAMGFYDKTGFHPIRASEDYSSLRAGEVKKPKRKKLVKKKRKITKKGGVKEMAKRKRRYRRNDPAKRRRRRSFRRNDPAKRRRRRSFRRNDPARRRRRRSFRRNAPITSVAGVQLTKPMTWIPYMLTGGVAAIVTGKAPSFVGAGDSPLWKYGSMGLTAFGGGWLVSRFLGRNYGYAWLIGSGAIIMSDVLSTYVLKQIGVSGLGEDLVESAEIGAYPYAEVGYYPYSDMGAYPYSEMGAYPYEY